MTGKRRSKLEIVSEALLCVSGVSKKKTSIMNFCELNSEMVNEVLSYLLEKNLVSLKDSEYSITKKGEAVLVLQLQLEEQLG